MHYTLLSRITRTVSFRRFIVFAPLALLATMSAGAQMVTQSRPYTGVTTNPCNGESVSFTGTIHMAEKTQVSIDGRIHYIANNNFNATGTGQTTRVTYNIGGTMQTNSKFPSFPITFRQRSRFISTGSAPSFFATVVFHVNGSGLQTNVTTESDCK